MNFKKLGNTDIKVSSICLGTMTWGQQNTQKEAFEQMDYALDRGVNFFDTAELYAVPMKPETRGKTSQFIGEWFLKTKNRDKIILADKVAGTSQMNWLRPNGEKTSLNNTKSNQFFDEKMILDNDLIERGYCINQDLSELDNLIDDYHNEEISKIAKFRNLSNELQKLNTNDQILKKLKQKMN